METAIRAAPGCDVRHLARATGLSRRGVLYHATALVEEGLVTEHCGVRRRFFPAAAGPGRMDRELVSVLREPGPLAVTLALLMNGATSSKELLARCRLPRSSLFHHLLILDGEGVVMREGDVSWLAEPHRVALVLRRCPPLAEELRFLRLEEWTSAQLAMWQVRPGEPHAPQRSVYGCGARES